MKLNQKNASSKADQILLIILDGVGYSDKGANLGNAVSGANLPNLNYLWNNHSTLHIQAHGKAVGMPSDEDMGNSEVGHNVLGCGRVFDQGAKLVSNSIEAGEMFRGQTWKDLIANVNKNRSTLHFIGLLSDGNVHSHIDHLKAMIKVAKEENIKKVRLHILLDGRDVPEKSALDYIDPIENFISELRSGEFDIKIASGGGRMTITMDRYEADWSMVDRGWNVHTLGVGRQFTSAKEAVETFRSESPGVIDQYLPEFVIAENGTPVGKIVDNDSVVFFNFRGDRAIEISRAFTENNFDKFNRPYFPKVYFSGMMQYDGDLKIPKNYLVTPPAIDKTMGEYMAKNSITQYAISETQKYGHVTFFWNGNRSDYFDRNLETYVEIHSDIIPFDQAPKMKAKEITDTLIPAMESKKYKFMRVNYANGDMVGHTGNYQATIKGLEFLDECISQLKEVADKTNTVLLITADHGNADEMYQLDKKGKLLLDKENHPSPKTSHTLNPVNLVLYDPKNKFKLNQNIDKPGLANIASTIFDLLGYEAPEDYHPTLLIR
jgi:2,3-bisphosphoglycerate-independent phosphoglycerate mutase